MADTGLSADEAERMIRLCEENNEVPPLPTVTGYSFPLDEPYAFELPNGNTVEMPAGVGFGRVMGMFAVVDYLTFGDSRIYFHADTWRPVLSETADNHIAEDDKAVMADILGRLREALPEYESDFESLFSEFLDS
jgi:hypothetical protein